MTAALPQPHEARQLVRLRQLRVQRLQARCQAARAVVDQAAQAVRQRQQAITQGQQQVDRLAHAVVHTLATQLPRWGGMAAAQRERLDEQLERDEYALIDEEQALEQAQEALARAAAELTRALAREDAVKDLATQSLRAHRRALEQRAERELDTPCRPPN